MLILDATNKTITAVLAGAITTSQPEATASWADDNGTSLVEGSSNIALNSTTPVTVVAAPASSTRRVIKDIYIENKDTVSVVLTVLYNNNGTTYNIEHVTLAPGQSWSLQFVGDKAIGATGPTGGTGPTGPTGPTGATGPSAITIGTTVVTGGTTTHILYNNAGVVGEYTVSGTGTEIPTTHKPTFVGTVQTIVAVAALALDGSAGSIFTKTIGTGSTLTQSNFTTGQMFMVKITGAFTVTWFSGITWITVGSTAPTQAAVTTYGFVCTGSNTFDGYLVGTE